MRRRGEYGIITRMKSDMVEYDIHRRGIHTDEALAMFSRIVSSERAKGRGGIFAVVTGYGSTGGTSLIKSAVLAACRRYMKQNHIKGFLDGEFAGDFFSPQCMAFPAASMIPVRYRRSPNPGLVFVCV